MILSWGPGVGMADHRFCWCRISIAEVTNPGSPQHDLGTSDFNGWHGYPKFFRHKRKEVRVIVEYVKRVVLYQETGAGDLHEGIQSPNMNLACWDWNPQTQPADCRPKDLKVGCQGVAGNRFPTHNHLGWTDGRGKGYEYSGDKFKKKDLKGYHVLSPGAHPKPSQ